MKLTEAQLNLLQLIIDSKLSDDEYNQVVEKTKEIISEREGEK